MSMCGVWECMSYICKYVCACLCVLCGVCVCLCVLYGVCVLYVASWENEKENAFVMRL